MHFLEVLGKDFWQSCEDCYWLPCQYSIPLRIPYGNEQIKVLAEFYGKEIEVRYDGMTCTSPPLLNGDDLLLERKIFSCAILLEKKCIIECKEESRSDIFVEMETSHAYGGILPETWKLLNIIMALPVARASAEQSFSQMKLIINSLYSCLSDTSEYFMKIVIEGLHLSENDFNEILHKKYRHISLQFSYLLQLLIYYWGCTMEISFCFGKFLVAGGELVWRGISQVCPCGSA